MDIFTVEFWQGVRDWLRPDMKNIKQAAEAEVTRQLVARRFTVTGDGIPGANPAGETQQRTTANLWQRGWRWCKEKRLLLLLGLSFIIIVFLCGQLLDIKAQPSYKGLHLWYGDHHLPAGALVNSGEVLRWDSLQRYLPAALRHEPAEWTFVSDPGSEVYHILLKDSTRICLSGDSRIRLCESYGLSERRLSLTGEAALQVFPYNKQVLTIESGQRQIITSGAVLGVSAYENSNYQASLVSGIMSVMIAGQPYVPVAGNAVTQDRETGKAAMKPIDTASVISWSTGDCYMFSGKTLYEVFAQLERWYGVRITADNPATGYYKYTNCINRKNSLKTVMESLRQTDNIQYAFDECGNVHACWEDQ
jgi:hypothetical protein